ncbi:MAG: sensor histidine kinase [Actinomycetota bacterium]|nr:sensor histidine kinase [Actinomycetota bacterium]
MLGFFYSLGFFDYVAIRCHRGGDSNLVGVMGVEHNVARKKDLGTKPHQRAEDRRKERRRSEDQQQVREKIIFAQELERKRWALEVHDRVTQLLIDVHWRLQAYRRKLARDPQKAQRDMDEIEDLVAESITEAKGLIDELRPSVLDDVGLVAAVKKYLRKVERGNSLDVKLLVDEKLDRIPSEVEIATYRIIQEALTNVRRHAKASHAEVEIRRKENDLIVRVSDEGCGFNIEAVNAEGDNWGLVCMQERAKVVGGSLGLRSEPGKGTTINLKVPI